MGLILPSIISNQFQKNQKKTHLFSYYASTSLGKPAWLDDKITKAWLATPQPSDRLANEDIIQFIINRDVNFGWTVAEFARSRFSDKHQLNGDQIVVSEPTMEEPHALVRTDSDQHLHFEFSP